MKTISLIALLILGALKIHPIMLTADDSVQILCDTTFNKYQTIRPLPGTLYRVLHNEVGYPTHQIQLVTQQGSQILDVPLPLELIGKVFADVVSPDGRYLALTPYDTGTPFIVWKIGTPELTTILLPDSDVDYLNQNIEPTSVQENMITWISNSELLIKYFDPEQPRGLLAEKNLTVVDIPFQILEGTYQEILYPNLPVPPDHSFPRYIYSPRKTYVTLVTSYLGFRLQIYDNQSVPSRLIKDLQPSDTGLIRSLPVWTPDESQFFIILRRDPDSSPVRNVIAQVYPQQDFQINTDLQQVLEAIFSPMVTVTSPAILQIDAAGDRFIFRIYDPQMQLNHLVIYHIDTGNITTICDGIYINAEFYFPLWGPNDDYFGYWDNGWIIGYDLTTGQGYRANGSGFIGWIDDTLLHSTIEGEVD